MGTNSSPNRDCPSEFFVYPNSAPYGDGDPNVGKITKLGFLPKFSHGQDSMMAWVKC